MTNKTRNGVFRWAWANLRNGTVIKIKAWINPCKKCDAIPQPCLEEWMSSHINYMCNYILWESIHRLFKYLLSDTRNLHSTRSTPPKMHKRDMKIKALQCSPNTKPCLVMATKSHEPHSVSTHQQLDCWFNTLFKLTTWHHRRGTALLAFVMGIHRNALLKGQ